MPAASEYSPSATSIVQIPSLLAVKVAVYMELFVTLKFDRLPLDTDILPTAKLLVSSVEVKVKANDELL